MATFDEIYALKKRHSASLLNLPGVCGVDIDTQANGNARLTVHVDDKETIPQLPKELEGHKLKYIASGPFQKQ